MTTSDTGMRLIRRVQGGRGSVCLYENPTGLAEVVEVSDDVPKSSSGSATVRRCAISCSSTWTMCKARS